MESIVRLFRVLANVRRIQVLRLLAVLGELPVVEIAQATRLDPARLSAHLGLMAGTGLLWRRRSGRTVYYRLAEQPGSPIVAAALAQLRRVFARIGVARAREVVDANQPDSPTASDAALFACFTSFTHPRRLQIISHLERHSAASLADLTAALAMSPRACFRHLDKLERRGFLRRRVRGHRTSYLVARGKGRLQQTLMRAVCARLTSMRK